MVLRSHAALIDIMKSWVWFAKIARYPFGQLLGHKINYLLGFCNSRCDSSTPASAEKTFNQKSNSVMTLKLKVLRIMNWENCGIPAADKSSPQSWELLFLFFWLLSVTVLMLASKMFLDVCSFSFWLQPLCIIVMVVLQHAWFTYQKLCEHDFWKGYSPD